MKKLKEKKITERSNCRTIKTPITFDGIGVHSGIKTRIELLPSNDGISFVMKESGSEKVIASIDNVLSTVHGTSIGNSKSSFGMVEHLLGTLFAFQIDGVTVVLEMGYEIPIFDGSALPIVDKLKRIKIVEVESGYKKREIKIIKPFSFNYKKSFLAVYPSKTFIISYFISYENYNELTQMKTLEITPETFSKEIAPARTYAFLEWIEPLRERGLIKGGSLNNSLVYSHEGLLNNCSLRFPDEFVRHKILDFLGDLSLMERRIIGHFIIVCGGHTAHIEFLKKLKTEIVGEEKGNFCK